MMFHKVLITVSVLVVVFVSGWHVDLANAQVIEDGLAGHWRLDEADIDAGTVADALGEHDGTIQGEPETVEGIIGEALNFDGTADYVVIGPVTDGTDLTYALWINVPALPKMAKVIIWDDNSAGGGDSWLELLPNGKIQTQRAGDGFGVVASASAVTPNEWLHVTFVTNAESGENVIYFNGERDVVGAGPIRSRTNISHVVLAVGHDSNAFIKPFYFEGAIDDVAIYNRSLSDEEVLENSRALAVSPAGRLSLTWGKIKTE